VNSGRSQQPYPQHSSIRPNELDEHANMPTISHSPLAGHACKDYSGPCEFDVTHRDGLVSKSGKSQLVGGANHANRSESWDDDVRDRAADFEELHPRTTQDVAARKKAVGEGGNQVAVSDDYGVKAGGNAVKVRTVGTKGN
jgi:hypothetical protein